MKKAFIVRSIMQNVAIENPRKPLVCKQCDKDSGHFSPTVKYENKQVNVSCYDTYSLFAENETDYVLLDEETKYIFHTPKYSVYLTEEEALAEIKKLEKEDE